MSFWNKLVKGSIAMVALCGASLMSVAPANAIFLFAPKESLGVPQSTSIRFGGPTTIPVGFFLMCESNPGACAMRRGSARDTQNGVMKLTAKRFSELKSVNARVNRQLRPIEDIKRFGVADRWTVGGNAGDCEDYAMTKRQQLMARGWPSSALLVAIVNSWSTGRHAVLVARTDQGDFVLDNLNPSVTPWTSAGYAWEKIQSPVARMVWVSM